MASRSKKNLLQLAGCCFALVFACLFSSTAVADTISHSGTFIDQPNPDSGPDDFTITNTSPDAYDITTLVIDFTSVAIAPVTFDEIGFAFAPGSEPVGFQSYIIPASLDSITLTFNDFDAGESFTFTIDVDDNNSRVESDNIAGATVTATFDVSGTPTNVAALMAAGGPNDTTWANSATVVPEPGTLVLVSLGLAGLAWTGRRR
jgi:hypothetical protein